MLHAKSYTEVIPNFNRTLVLWPRTLKQQNFCTVRYTERPQFTGVRRFSAPVKSYITVICASAAFCLLVNASNESTLQVQQWLTIGIKVRLTVQDTGDKEVSLDRALVEAAAALIGEIKAEPVRQSITDLAEQLQAALDEKLMGTAVPAAGTSKIR